MNLSFKKIQSCGLKKTRCVPSVGKKNCLVGFIVLDMPQWDMANFDPLQNYEMQPPTVSN